MIEARLGDVPLDHSYVMITQNTYCYDAEKYGPHAEDTEGNRPLRKGTWARIVSLHGLLEVISPTWTGPTRVYPVACTDAWVAY